jgi:hypothetical protein
MLPAASKRLTVPATSRAGARRSALEDVDMHFPRVPGPESGGLPLDAVVEYRE